MKRIRKSRHNKKRNTAFLFEVLIQDITKSVVDGDYKRKEAALNICKECFSKNSVLGKERELYNSLLEIKDIEFELLGKLLHEVKKEHAKLDRNEIFNAQTKMINRVNKELSGGVFNNFVSNYKNLATISQILSQDLPVKKRVVLENLFVKNKSLEHGPEDNGMEPTDNLVYKTFVESYNKQYGERLLAEQKEVVTRFATSFSDNGVSLKVYLNEEFGRLKEALKNSMDKDMMKEDDSMSSKTQEVLSILESYEKGINFDEDVIVQILEIQDLVKEIES
jgi:hypothetical protein